jgi:hypothetical protein
VRVSGEGAENSCKFGSGCNLDSPLFECDIDLKGYR